MLSFQRAVTLAFSVSALFTSVHAHSQRRNALNYLSLVESPEIRTPSNRVHSSSTFDLTFNLHQDQQRIKLSLEPNHDILPDDAVVEYLDQEGNVARVEKIVRSDHKVFKGLTWVENSDGDWVEAGWARIVVRRDGLDPLFEGAFSIMRDHHHVQLRSNYMRTKHQNDPILEDTNAEYMVIFRDSDFGQDSYHQELKRSAEPSPQCAHDSLSFNIQPSHPVYTKMLKRSDGVWGSMSFGSILGKRQIDNLPTGGGNSGGVNLKSTIGQTAGCPSTRKVALMGVATDCSYTGDFNSTDAVRQNVITQINSASNLYERTFNITLGLQNLTVSDKNCPGSQQAATPWNTACAGNTTIQDRLNEFSNWRGSRNDTNAFWTLLTLCNTGQAVGLAWLGQACIQGVQTAQQTGGGAESVASANVVARTNTEWQVIAHETGHTFGAVHDCDSQTCSDGNTVNSQQCCPLSADTCDAGAKYIMNPSTGQGITDFSPCSIGNICSALGRNSVKSDCLTANKGVVTISGNQCGNGIVEEGEDCDCGGTENCAGNNCCDPTTCKFKTNAVCDDSNEDCCKGCQFASANTICRPSTGTCDPQEVCTGHTAVCPADVTAPDGQACGNSSLSLTCASGQCTSRDQQCKTLMGSYTQKNDTYACDSINCQLSCASPEFGLGTCYGMQQNFLDGTSCGGGGKCSNGICKGSNGFKEIGSWISRHKALVIAVASVLGVLLLFSLTSCLYRCCTRRRNLKRNKAAAKWPGPGMQMRDSPPYGAQPNYWNGPPPPPPPYSGPSVRYA